MKQELKPEEMENVTGGFFRADDSHGLVDVYKTRNNVPTDAANAGGPDAAVAPATQAADLSGWVREETPVMPRRRK